MRQNGVASSHGTAFETGQETAGQRTEESSTSGLGARPGARPGTMPGAGPRANERPVYGTKIHIISLSIALLDSVSIVSI